MAMRARRGRTRVRADDDVGGSQAARGLDQRLRRLADQHARRESGTELLRELAQEIHADAVVGRDGRVERTGPGVELGLDDMPDVHPPVDAGASERPPYGGPGGWAAVIADEHRRRIRPVRSRWWHRGGARMQHDCYSTLTSGSTARCVNVTSAQTSAWSEASSSGSTPAARTSIPRQNR